MKRMDFVDTLPEACVAGSILIDARCLHVARSIVKADDFKIPVCGAVFRSACRLADAGEVIDPVTIQADAAKHGDDLPTETLTLFMETTPTAANIREHAQCVKDEAIRRRIATLGTQIEEQAYDMTIGTAELIASVMEKTETIRSGTAAELITPEDTASNFLEYRESVAENGGAVVPTGYSKLDAILGGGMVKEGLYILAARPGIGKTTFGMKIADSVAQRKPVLFVSLEMSETQLTARRIADRSGVSVTKVMLAPEYENDTQEAICRALENIAESHLFINKRPSASVADIAVLAHATSNLALIVIDYLGLIQSEDGRASIYERTTNNSNSLKRLARSLGVPILCLAQLNRDSAQRADKRPLMSDLRDSGAIEQDADGVILLHRPSAYLPNGDPNKPKPWEPELFEVDVVKNRHGATGNITLSFYGNNGRLRE